MSEDPVEPQEEQEKFDDVVEKAVEEQPEEQQEEVIEQAAEQKQVPLSALQKERQKRRELELKLQWEQQRQQQQVVQKPIEDDNSHLESATKGDLRQSQGLVVRDIEEKLWRKANPDKYEEVMENIEVFLKQRPNLAHAINQSENRLEEAYTLMTALSPKQQTQLRKEAAPKKTAPNAPSGVPKAAALNESVDVMSMSDSEFSAWKQSKRKRR